MTACLTIHNAAKPVPASGGHRSAQGGFTLLELLVGMFIGLIITGVALGTLMLTRATSSTISEVAQLQQQAAYALQIMGNHIRQTGSYELQPALNSTTAFTFTDYPAGFTRFGGSSGTGSNPDTFTIGTQTPIAGVRDCKGTEVTATAYTTTFDLKDGVLRCNSNVDSSSAQPIIENVTDFQVWYRNYKIDAVGNYSFQRQEAPRPLTATRGVAAIEICLELKGSEKLPKTDTKYTNCQGEEKEIGENLRRVFRNVYSVRVTAF